MIVPLALSIGKNVKAIIKADLKLEIGAVVLSNEAARIAADEKDNSSRNLFISCSRTRKSTCTGSRPSCTRSRSLATNAISPRKPARSSSYPKSQNRDLEHPPTHRYPAQKQAEAAHTIRSTTTYFLVFGAAAGLDVLLAAFSGAETTSVMSMRIPSSTSFSAWLAS